MSVININFAADSVALYSDTMVYRGNTADGLCARKIELAANGRFAWGFRGSVAIGDSFDALARHEARIEAAAAGAKAFLESLSAGLLRAAGGHAAAHIILAGWADSIGDLMVLDVHRDAAAGMTVRRLGRGIYLNPTVRGRATTLPATATARQMIAVARAQKRFDDTWDSGLCIGGVLHETTATRDGVRQRIVDLYPDYDRHAAAFGDPNAEEVARFRGEALAKAA